MHLVLLSFLVILANFCVSPSSAWAWRSSMYQDNWQAVDKKILPNINLFFDTSGIKDEEDFAVGEGHPAYHPWRFLHDFSYAGYHAGEVPIPPDNPNWSVPPEKIFNVLSDKYKDLGCKNDGVADCTAAIHKALRDVEATGGVVYLPAGEYRVTQQNEHYFLRIRRSNIILKGDGSNLTKIKVDPYTTVNGERVFRMVDNAVIDVQPSEGKDWDWIEPRVPITANLPFPTKVIPVADVTKFKEKDPIVIMANFRQGEVVNELYLKEHDMLGIWDKSTNSIGYIFRRTVEKIEKDPLSNQGNLVVDVPIRYRIKTTDNPFVALVAPGISEIGIWGISFGMIRHPLEWDFEEAPNEIYDAQEKYQILRENWRGYLMQFFNVSNSWLYDVASYTPSENVNRPTSNDKYGLYDVDILNQIILFRNNRFVTLKNFYFKNMQADRGSGNGYGITLFTTNEVLIEHGLLEKVKKGFAFNGAGSSGNVIRDLTVKEVFTTPNDFHSYLSMSNLIEKNDLQGTFWESAVRPIDKDTFHGHGTTQTVYWNNSGTPITFNVGNEGNWDRDNDNDGELDKPATHDPAMIVSNQVGWGYVMCTSGIFPDVVTAAMPNRSLDSDEPWHPTILPRDWSEGIGRSGIEPDSLYLDQLGRRVNSAVFVRGDITGDSRVDLSDSQALLNHLFKSAPLIVTQDAADTDDNGQVDIADSIYLLKYLFMGGLSLPAPFPYPGIDPTSDSLAGAYPF